MDIHLLLATGNWEEIPNCPGRYVLKGARVSTSPAEIIGEEAETFEFQTDRARDTVVVARISGGGLISYKRKDGSFLHTLNTPEGFRRKLDQLGIDPPRSR